VEADHDEEGVGGLQCGVEPGIGAPVAGPGAVAPESAGRAAVGVGDVQARRVQVGNLTEVGRRSIGLEPAASTT
jgi:hypothetical protein